MAKKKEVKESTQKRDNAGLLIGAGVLIGLGVGFLIEQIPAGIFLGIGLGLLAAFFVKRK